MGHNSGLIIAGALIGLVILLMLLNWAAPGVLADGDNVMHVIYSVVLLSALLVGFSSDSRGSAALMAKQVVAWLGIFLLVVVGYTYREDFLGMFSRVQSEVAPNQPVQQGKNVYLKANRFGHFEVVALVNNRRVEFLVDTGATSVALTKDDARRIGLRPDKLNYNQPVSTANGITYVARTNLRVVKIGDIVISNVPASVHQDNSLSQSLLGMSYLNKLRGFSVNKNTLVLQQ